jgi:hypothetical protein
VRNPLNLNPDAFVVYGRVGIRSKAVRFLLGRGRLFERATLPARRGGWCRTAKLCFRNTYCNVKTDPARYWYCEGFCWKDSQGYPPEWAFPHAWFIDCEKPGVALDATLSHDCEYRYFGIAIGLKSVFRAAVAENGHASVLDYWEKIHQTTLKGLQWQSTVPHIAMPKLVN